MLKESSQCLKCSFSSKIIVGGPLKMVWIGLIN